MQEIGLFPLGIVLLPHERVPLHIFEEGYKELIEECLSSEEPFGLILSDGEELEAVGTLARIDEVTKRFPDGRLNIVIEGLQRFRVVETTAGRSFVTATISELTDGEATPTRSEIEELLAAFAQLAEAAKVEAPTMSMDSDDRSFRLAALVELENASRQELLELESEHARTARLTELFTELAMSIRRQIRARSRAESNGRVDPRD